MPDRALTSMWWSEVGQIKKNKLGYRWDTNASDWCRGSITRCWQGMGGLCLTTLVRSSALTSSASVLSGILRVCHFQQCQGFCNANQKSGSVLLGGQRGETKCYFFWDWEPLEVATSNTSAQSSLVLGNEAVVTDAARFHSNSLLWKVQA